MLPWFPALRTITPSLRRKNSDYTGQELNSQAPGAGPDRHQGIICGVAFDRSSISRLKA